ncbi:MAG: tetratricopeptide repeat protein [Candidatus Verstraetearchaeota archaeon]|nr:tetratricopeptide repeat protein [Candidatus Verstraetearchaeota archaeon]
MNFSEKKQDSQASFHEAESHYAKASKLEQQGRYEEAIAEMDKAIELIPNLDHYRYTKIRILELAGRREEAIKEYDKLLAILPKDAGAHFSKAYFLFLKTQRYEESREEYDKAIEINPNKWEYRYWKGRVLSLMGKYEESLKEYDKAIEIIAVVSDVLRYDFALYRGVALLGLGRYEESISEFNKAIGLYQDEFTAYMYKGYSLAKMHRYDESAQEFQRALQIRPGSVPTYVNYSKLHAIKGDIEGGLRLLTALLKSGEADQDLCKFIRGVLTGEKDRELGRIMEEKEREMLQAFLRENCPS